jgi:hypothetical protein
LLNVACICAQVDAAGVGGAVLSNNKLHLCGNGITVAPHSTMVSRTICLDILPLLVAYTHAGSHTHPHLYCNIIAAAVSSVTLGISGSRLVVLTYGFTATVHCDYYDKALSSAIHITSYVVLL